MNRFVLTSLIALALGSLALGGEEKPPQPPMTYYETLQSLLSSKHRKVRPKSESADVNKIEPHKGAGGVAFGQTMDDVVAVWGKPHGILVDPLEEAVTLSIGGSDFSFRDNKLFAITIHGADLPKAYLTNGVTLKTPAEKIKKIMGEPTEVRFGGTLVYEDQEGYTIALHMVSENLRFPFGDEEPDTVMCVTIEQPPP